MKRDEAGCTMQPSSITYTSIRAALILLAWLSCTAESIIVPSGKVGPITPYSSTARPTPDPSRIRDPAPVVEYSADNPEPPPLDPSYVPQSYKTLSALSGNSIFYIPLKIRNIHAFQGNVFPYVSRQPAAVQPHSQPKYVTWKARYDSPAGAGADRNPQPDVRIAVPVQEVDYSFPKKQRYGHKMNPIVVAPLPPVQQDYYHFKYNTDFKNQQYNGNYNNNYNANGQVKDKYADPLEDKSSAGHNHYRYDNANGQYPKKYNHNSDGSTTKYYYYVKHDYRTDYNSNPDSNYNNNNNDGNNSKNQ